MGLREKLFKDIKIKNCIIAVLSSTFLAFGLYHVHSLSGVTEGGVIGLNLLLEHWFGISPSVTNFVANVICYALGWKILGRIFLVYSGIATVSFSVAYRIFEQFEPLWPQLYNMPLVASVVGAIFVGVGAGACVRIGGAISGDDALAMGVSHLTGLKGTVGVSDQRSCGAYAVYQLYSAEADRVFTSDGDHIRTADRNHTGF